MSESRLVPSNLMAWPSVVDLSTEQKLAVYHLWATADAACGCWLLDIRGFSAGISISAEALSDCLLKLKNSGHIILDEETREIFIMQWFRWHKFGGIRQRLLSDSVARIQSPKLMKTVKALADLVLDKNAEKSVACHPSKAKESKNKKREAELNACTSHQPKPSSTGATLLQSSKVTNQRKVRRLRSSGIVTYYQDDQKLAEFLETSVNSSAIDRAITIIIEQGKEPVPGRVQKALEVAKTNQAVINKQNSERAHAHEKLSNHQPLSRERSRFRAAEALSVVKPRETAN